MDMGVARLKAWRTAQVIVDAAIALTKTKLQARKVTEGSADPTSDKGRLELLRERPLVVNHWLGQRATISLDDKRTLLTTTMLEEVKWENNMYVR